MAATLATLLNAIAVDELADMLGRLPDPDYLLQQAGVSRADLRRLEGDDEISAALETRREAVVATPWRMEPWDGNPVAEWVWGELEPHMPTLLRDIWSAVPYGYSVVEMVWRRTGDGRLGIDRLDAKPFEWFEPRRDGTLIWRDSHYVEHSVDTADKFFLTRRLPTYRQPYGEALLSRLYWPWYFRTNGWQFWARFLERHGSPLLVGKSADTGAMLSALSAAVQSAVLSVDRDDDVSAVASANAGEAFAAFSAAVDRRVQKVVLGQTLTTDVTGSGSYAAAKVHDDVRDDRRLADCAMISTTVQRIVDALVRRNFPAAEPPAFIFADQMGLEPERAARDATLAQAGICRFTEQYLLDRYDFEVGDFTLPAVEPMATMSALSVQRGALLAAPKPQRFTQDQASVEALADAALEAAASPVPASAIRAAILASESPEDLYERLATLYGGQDAEDFQELVARSLFAADVLGYTNAQQRVGGG